MSPSPRRSKSEQLLSNLNPPQVEAVTHGDGPLLVFAGAGSGKTRVLTYRAAYLIRERGVPAHQILAVTFTNKAANEMKTRIAQLIGEQVRGMWMGTFHSICARMLRADGERIGLDPRFTIFDESDQSTLMKECLRDIGQENTFPPAMVLDTVSKAKNELIGPAEFARTAQTGYDRLVAEAYQLYQRRLAENRAVDFDDLIMHAVRLLEQHPDVLAEYHERFRYILVDEYQDINFAQYRLIQLLAQKHRNLCVVGDDDQSIYGWRGADMRIILNFERDYPDAKVVKLEQNYRSTAPILAAAHEVIRRNQQRKPKQLFTEREGGATPVCQIASDEHEEAVYVAEKIRELMRDGRRPSDFAVLYRIHAQSRAIEKVFVTVGLPYKIVGGVRFFERAEIKDMLAYLRVINNPFDSISLKRILNKPPRNIGDTTLTRLEQATLHSGRPLWEVVQAADSLGLDPQRQHALSRFAELIAGLRELARTEPVTEVTAAVIERSGYARWLEEEGSLKARSRLENVRELLSAAKEFEEQSGQHTVENFLEQVALLADPESISEGPDAVSLMTLHSAKGLEFPVVFMVGMEEGIFPLASAITSDNPLEIEEERRLCYVGMTRAKDQLYCTLASTRTIFGATNRYPMSRFLRELPEELIRGREGAFSMRDMTWKAADSAASQEAQGIVRGQAPPLRFGKGELVRHRDFGEGVVIDASQTIVTVAFRTAGVKKLAVDIAPLERA